MSIKVLKIGQARPQGSISSLLYDPYTDPTSKLYKHLPSIRTNVPEATKGALDNVISYVMGAASDISKTDISALAAKLKIPTLIVIGIAAAAAIIYLVYKVYTNRESIGRAIDEFVKDIKRVAPDLSGVPGWLDSIKSAISAAFQSENPATAVSELANVKAAVIEHQKTIDPSRVGTGLDFFADYPYPIMDNHTGAGIKVPVRT